MEKGRILLAVTGFNPQRWHELLSATREVVLEPDGPTDPSITYAVVWKQRPNLLAQLPNLRAIFSIGAGVDHIFNDPGLPDVPIVRVVDENLTQYMTEYVVWRVLDHHRQGMLYRGQQKKKIWHEPQQRPAERHFGRHHGSRPARPRRGARAAGGWASGSMAGAAPSRRWPVSPPSAATRAWSRSSTPPTFWSCCCR